VHRYASDAAVVAALVHAVRIVVQRRAWGPRVLAWVSGLALLGLVLLCGVTGFVLVWDGFGRALAVESARILDALPILSEPVSRAFLGERPVPGTFFFLTSSSTLAVPLGMGLPSGSTSPGSPAPHLPRRLTWGIIGLLLAAAVAVPLGMEAEGDAFSSQVASPWTGSMPGGADDGRCPRAWCGSSAWGDGASCSCRAGPVPAGGPAASWVDEGICVGCRQCAWDCPYEAITMRSPRRRSRRGSGPGRSGAVRELRICAGSCAPMGAWGRRDAPAVTRSSGSASFSPSRVAGGAR
jgi:NAD-dependent dihydropyrimidine dehydrogenase PreA subunit